MEPKPSTLNFWFTALVLQAQENSRNMRARILVFPPLYLKGHVVNCAVVGRVGGLGFRVMGAKERGQALPPWQSQTVTGT